MAGVYFLPRAEHFRRHLMEMLAVCLATIVIASCAFGCILGCTHTLPVHPIVALTAPTKGVLVYLTIPRKSEMCERRRVCGGDPKKIPGTGCCVPFKDYFTTVFGLKPKGQTHFDVDPYVLSSTASQPRYSPNQCPIRRYPRQEAVLYCYVEDYKHLMQNIDIQAILARLRGEADRRQREELLTSTAGMGAAVDKEIRVLEDILHKAHQGRRDESGHRILGVVAGRAEVSCSAQEVRHSHSMGSFYITNRVTCPVPGI